MTSLTYSGAHKRLQRTKGPASQHACPCGAPAAQWAYMGGAVDEAEDERGCKYSGDPSSYEARCASCHIRQDMRTAGFRPAPHGTDRGYEQHRRDGSPRCQPCKTAHTRYTNGQRAQRNAARKAVR